ncbi:hypothetical protein KIPB_000109 [Kipferlia bialata]|uniref:Uncharacterized protein n=1 Tax=Kipferlia bialata TaxID=797122 RepID=A0A9K3CN26_9EUKA|nr:hypothetical protein KIPB_000109 [Kipferlia bialata]|eukprot:g109.t1
MAPRKNNAQRRIKAAKAKATAGARAEAAAKVRAEKEAMQQRYMQQRQGGMPQGGAAGEPDMATMMQNPEIQALMAKLAAMPKKADGSPDMTPEQQMEMMQQFGLGQQQPHVHSDDCGCE